MPVVHLHGGEVTEGALDERVRHAVTKLADQHCVASEDAAAPAAPARRAGRPGPRDRGARARPARDGAPPIDDDDLGRPARPDRVERPVAPLHLPPADRADRARRSASWAREAAEAALAACGTVVATHPGMDEGRDEILAALTDLAAREPRLRLVDALGRDYPRVLAATDVVVGNSSSGVIEAATLHVPAVDIGERQRGRLRGDNVVHAAEGRAAVEAALRHGPQPALARALGPRRPTPTARVRRAPRILDIVRTAALAPRAKRFVDLRRPATDMSRTGESDSATTTRGGGGVTARDLRAACAPTTATIRDALEVVDRSGNLVCLLVDDDDRLAGLLTDGDLRRAFLKGTSLDDLALDHATRSPHFVAAGSPRALVLDLMQALRISAVPELADDRTLVGPAHALRRRRVGAAAQRRRRSWPAAAAPGSAT